MIDNTTPSPIQPGTKLYRALARACADASVKKVIEIGGGIGNGSTQALLLGLQNKTLSDLEFISIELSTRKFVILESALAGYSFASAINGNSISVADYMTPQEIAQFYFQEESDLGKRRLKRDVLRSLQEEIDYISTRGEVLTDDALTEAITDMDSEVDFIFIDGSEFCGEAHWNIIDELSPAPKYIALNDTLSLKNFFIAKTLTDDSGNWKLFAAGKDNDVEWKIFKKI